MTRLFGLWFDVFLPPFGWLAGWPAGLAGWLPAYIGMKCKVALFTVLLTIRRAKLCKLAYIYCVGQLRELRSAKKPIFTVLVQFGEPESAK